MSATSLSSYDPVKDKSYRATSLGRDVVCSPSTLVAYERHGKRPACSVGMGEPPPGGTACRDTLKTEHFAALAESRDA